MARVSIPKRVSAKVELLGTLVLGFVVLFQSLKGFQPKWNVGRDGLGVQRDSVVSIPKRVSAKVERVV